MTEPWSNVLVASFKDVWLGVAGFLPKLIVAFVIVVVGWIVGAVLRKLIVHLFRILRVDNILKQAKVDKKNLREILIKYNLDKTFDKIIKKDW